MWAVSLSQKSEERKKKAFKLEKDPITPERRDEIQKKTLKSKSGNRPPHCFDTNMILRSGRHVIFRTGNSIDVSTDGLPGCFPSTYTQRERKNSLLPASWNLNFHSRWKIWVNEEQRVEKKFPAMVWTFLIEVDIAWLQRQGFHFLVCTSHRAQPTPRTEHEINNSVKTWALGETRRSQTPH